MAQSTDPMAGATAPAQDAAGQIKDSSWPKPGEEGYVHPDGTAQSVQQLEDNRRAAADRAAAGSLVHGAPGPQRGGDPGAVNAAVARAEAYSGPSNEERDKALTDSIREGQAALDQVADAAPPAGRENTADNKPRSTR